MAFTEELHCIEDVKILVFKTNASLFLDMEVVAGLFDNAEGFKEWNFDLEDCDRIFRVVSEGINSDKVISLLKQINIEAIELKD